MWLTATESREVIVTVNYGCLLVVVDKFLLLFVFPKMFNCLLDCYSIQMNGTNCVNLSSYQYCTFLEWVHVHVLFIMMYKEVLTFGSLNEILECNYSNESY